MTNTNHKRATWGAIILAGFTLASQIVTYLQTRQQLSRQSQFLTTDRGYNAKSGGYGK